MSTPGHLAVEERFGRPVGTHDLALGIQQEERFGQGIECAFELGSLARKLRPFLGPEPGQALDRWCELAGKKSLPAQGLDTRFAPGSPAAVIHVRRASAPTCSQISGPRPPQLRAG